jgi:hypothetical protein
MTVLTYTKGSHVSMLRVYLCFVCYPFRQYIHRHLVAPLFTKLSCFVSCLGDQGPCISCEAGGKQPGVLGNGEQVRDARVIQQLILQSEPHKMGKN